MAYWNGNLPNGKEAASGMYLVQLFVDGKLAGTDPEDVQLEVVVARCVDTNRRTRQGLSLLARFAFCERPYRQWP